MNEEELKKMKEEAERDAKKAEALAKEKQQLERELEKYKLRDQTEEKKRLEEQGEFRRLYEESQNANLNLQKQMIQREKERVLIEELRACNVSANPKTLLRLVDLDSITLNQNNEFENVEAAIERLKLDVPLAFKTESAPVDNIAKTPIYPDFIKASPKNQPNMNTPPLNAPTSKPVVEELVDCTLMDDKTWKAHKAKVLKSIGQKPLFLNPVMNTNMSANPRVFIPNHLQP